MASSLSALLKRSGNPVFGGEGIGILAFRQLSGIAAFHKIVTRFYFKIQELIHTPMDLFPGALFYEVGNRVDMGGGKTI